METEYKKIFTFIKRRVNTLKKHGYSDSVIDRKEEKFLGGVYVDYMNMLNDVKKMSNSQKIKELLKFIDVTQSEMRNKNLKGSCWNFFWFIRVYIKQQERFMSEGKSVVSNLKDFRFND